MGTNCFNIKKTKLHGLSPWANYTDRATFNIKSSAFFPQSVFMSFV
jgi:hypothetical protein